jgi:hypothetical protein
MITDQFSRRTLHEMELALERACAMRPDLFVRHQSRKFVAQRIMDAALGKSPPMDELTAVGRQAVADLASRLAQHPA